MVQGQNQQSRTEKATEFEGGTVHLCSSANAIGDGDTSITSDASTATAASDWSITHDNTAGTTKLENSNNIDFGSASGFTIAQIVIESTDTTGNFIIDDSPSGDVDLSGDGDVSLEANSLTYTIGSE